MKRAISMLIAIVMVLSMVPAVFASSETVVVEDISEIAVVLNADNGYYAEYSWTPSEDGELSVYQYTEKEIEVQLMQGDNFATSFFEDEDGTYYGFGTAMNVVAGEEVIIVVFNSVEEDETFSLYGSFYGAPGKSIDNPIYLEGTEAIVSNSGTLYYAGFFGGADVTVTGTGDFSVILNGETIAAENGVAAFPGVGKTVIFAIVGEGDFVVKANYPVGSQMNPEILMRPAYIFVNLAEGNDQGYYYKWTAMDAGQFKLTCPEIEGVTYDVSLYNLNTWAMSTLQESEDNTVAVNVSFGDEIQIHVVALPDENMAYPAVSTGLTGELLQNIGTRENPEVIFGAEEIPVDIAEGNNQGYYYKWTTFSDGTLTLTCPTVEGVEYEVILTNMTTYAQAWLSDSTNGTVSIAVANGDAVVIEIGIIPDASWNYPALTTTLTGSFEYPVGSYDNPEAIFRPANIPVNIAENAFEYYYKWTANGDGTLVLTLPTVEGVDYQVILTNNNTYDMAWSADGQVSMDVSRGDEILIQVAVNSEDFFTAPALTTTLTGEFVFPVGTQMNPEILFRPSYINVNIPEGNNQGYFYKWTANADGALKLTCPTVEGVNYDVNMTNMRTYAQAWLIDSTDGTITLDVKAGDEIIIQVCAMPDAAWNTPALSVALTGEFIFPIGTQMNPEILFRPSYINVNIPEGNNQGYFYKWTANSDGTLKLACPTVEGVAYDVNMTNMRTYAQAWLIDSSDGTISLDVKAGDEVIIQVCAMPDAAWNTPALSVGLSGIFVDPVGSMMNPEVLTAMEWTYSTVTQTAGDFNGYFYTYTAAADGMVVLYFTDVPSIIVEDATYDEEGWELTPAVTAAYVADIMVTNMNTYAQYSLLQDGVDNYGLELQIPVKAGDELVINTVLLADTNGNRYPAGEYTWCGNFSYPAGTEQNPINIEWIWNDAYTAAEAVVNVAAGETLYFSGNAGMILTVNGVETEMDEMGVFTITNTGDAEAAYTVAMATPVGEYSNPENIEALPFEDSNSLAVDQSYHYIWTATENGTVTLTVTAGANITVDKLTYVEDSEWPISEQFALAEPTIDENWNYVGWDVADKLVIDVTAGQQLKIQVNGLTNWETWATPAVDYTLNMAFEGEETAAIVAQPQAVTANSGETVQFKVETFGEVVSYKWEYRKIYKWFATEMEGYNTDTLTVPVTGARNGYDYRCVVTFADGTVLVSEPAELTVNSTIVITGNPNDQIVANGYKGQFTAAAEGESITYTWQYKRPGDESWHYTTMEGNNKPTVMIETNAQRDGYQYRCEIKDATGAVAYTEAATMTVLYYTAQPVDVRTEAGTNVTFSVETNAPVVRYEWQYSKDGVKWSTTTMTGYNTATLTVEATAARDGYQYRCVITGAKDSKAYSKVATLYIGAPAVITAQPESTTAKAGATVTFSVEATNVLTYQWQYTKDGTNWYTTTMTGATTDALEVAVTAGRNGYQYRCAITGTDGEVVYTEAATLTVG